MSFLYRPRSIHVLQKDGKQSNNSTPLPPAIENVPKKHIRPRTGASLIMRRVSSIFLLKKKPLPDLKLANSVVHHRTIVSSTPSSSRESFESEDDIRRPSGLGRAAANMSNLSLPPSPFSPSSRDNSPCPSQDYHRTRAISSPNLLQSVINKGRVKPKSRRASITNDLPVEHDLPSLPPRHSPSPVTSRLPKEVIVHVLSYLSRGAIASCSQVSKPFTAAARYSLYNTLNFDSLSLLQLEQLVALLASRRDLTELVSTFICHKWPSFFISDCHCRGGPPLGYVFQHKDALLTATLTLALERMTNITSLTLPAFDASLISHHTAFGLRRLTFMNYMISESDTRALFSWLDGRINIVSLKFVNLEDVHTPLDIVSYRHSGSSGRPGTAPASPFLAAFPSTPSPHSCSGSTNVQQQQWPPLTPTTILPFSSPNLLPNLVELHATPSILSLLAPSLGLSPTPTPSIPLPPSLPFSFPLPLPILKRLATVSLNITTTLYTGLRPATLMSSLRGISHLCLKFGTSVDRRTFEKVVGAAGGVLGGREGVSEGGGRESGWIGLRSLEVGFQDRAEKLSGRDEALYKALQTSLPRYKSLQSLRLFVSQTEHQHEPFVDDLHPFPHNDNGDSHDEDDTNVDGVTKPSGVEQILIDSWLKMCPSLEVVALFSGARWRKE